MSSIRNDIFFFLKKEAVVFRNTELFYPTSPTPNIYFVFIFPKISPLYFYNLQTNFVILLSYSFYLFLFFYPFLQF